MCLQVATPLLTTYARARVNGLKSRRTSVSYACRMRESRTVQIGSKRPVIADHAIRATDTPGFKPFTKKNSAESV